MERHNEGCVIPVFREKFHSYLNVDVTFPMIDFAKFPHFTPFGEAQVFDGLHVFLSGQGLQFPFQGIDWVFVWEEVCDSESIGVSHIPVLIDLSFSLK